MTINIAAMSAPFPATEIEWRVGSTNNDKTKGLALAYLTARHIMDRLDMVCGPENWQDRYEVHGAKTICYLSVRIGEEWITKADGAGDSDVEAEKGAISDALKRAAVKWGIGRYLYLLGNTWVEVEAGGRSVRIVKSEYPRLEKILIDRFGDVESAPIAGPPKIERISSGKAKVILNFPAMVSEIETAETVRILDNLDEFYRSTAEPWLPGGWSERLLDLVRARRHELESEPEVTTISANESLDRQFAATMGPK